MRQEKSEKRLLEDFDNCHQIFKTFDMLEDDDFDEDKIVDEYNKLIKENPFHESFKTEWVKTLHDPHRIITLLTGNYYNAMCNVYNLDTNFDKEHTDVLLLQDKNGVLVSFVYITNNYTGMIGIRGSVRNMDGRIIDRCSITKIMYAGAALVAQKLRDYNGLPRSRFSPENAIGGARIMVNKLLKSENQEEKKLGLMMKHRMEVDSSFLWRFVISKCKTLEQGILIQKKPEDVDFVVVTEKTYNNSHESKPRCGELTLKNTPCRNFVSQGLSTCRLHEAT